MTAGMAMLLERGVIKNVTNSSDPATRMLINNLIFAQSKSVRTSTIILASFNVFAAFCTAMSILYDLYWASKRCNPKFKASYVANCRWVTFTDWNCSKFCVSTLHPAETFPLILSTGIVFQGIIFAIAQGQGMESISTAGCDIIAQYMLPGEKNGTWENLG